MPINFASTESCQMFYIREKNSHSFFFILVTGMMDLFHTHKQAQFNGVDFCFVPAFKEAKLTVQYWAQFGLN